MDFSLLRQQIAGTSLASLDPFLDPAYIASIRHGDCPRWLDLIGALPGLTAGSLNIGDQVAIGDASECSETERASLEQQLQQFIPWRKGPFSLFGIDIDTEWRSNMKWDRLLPHIHPLENRQVLDVGSGNGYHCFRMLQEGASLTLGIDPHIAYVAQFWAMKRYTSALPVYVLPLALEQLPPRLSAFDSVFSMGVLYHRKSPIEHLLQLRDCLGRGGELILETLFVDGPKGYCLTPEKKYARMSNVWFLPSIPTLISWLHRCGFENIRVVDYCETSAAEQRRTSWMPFDSLESALNPDELSQTIEGLPAPNRAIVLANAK